MGHGCTFQIGRCHDISMVSRLGLHVSIGTRLRKGDARSCHHDRHSVRHMSDVEVDVGLLLRYRQL